MLHFSGYHERSIYGASYSVKQDITMNDLLQRAHYVIRNEIDVTRHQLQRNRIEVLPARASFIDSHTVRVTYSNGQGFRDVNAETIVIAVGTSATLGDHSQSDNGCIFTSDQILTLDKLPRTLAVIGGGVIGCEYATIFAALGVRVTLIDARDRLLPFIDTEIIDALVYEMRQNRITLRLGEAVSAVEPFADDHGEKVRLRLESGKQIVSDKALYSIGRTGATEGLALEAAGLKANSRGRIAVNEHYQTEAPHIYAVGDVIGFPSLASTAMEQGRVATCHAYGIKTTSVPEFFPYGIYTIPEISSVGKSEEELTEEGVPYEVGKATYREIARGQILGDSSGLLKLIFHLETRKLLSVSVLGVGASELIHIGQAVMAHDGPIDYFVNTVFNYPTLAECYKTAALDGINRLG